MTHLSQLIGSYLHQDWPLEAALPLDAIGNAIATEPVEFIRLCGDELEELLGKHTSESALRRIVLDEMMCAYDPAADGLLMHVWLKAVLRKLRS